MKIEKNMWKHLRRLAADAVENSLSLIYPNRCQICETGVASQAQGYVCGACWSGRGAVKFIVPPFCDRCGLPFEGDITSAFECPNCRDMGLHFEFARAAVAAQGIVREVIHRYKYDRALWFEPFLSDLMVRAAPAWLRKEDWDLIVPVPLHWMKHREREFNQAERLSRCLATVTGIPVEIRLLKRVLSTQTQTRLTRRQRDENVRRAFTYCGRSNLNGQRVILVDDVLTTGATTSACAGVLKGSGAEKVCVWTVARGL